MADEADVVAWWNRERRLAALEQDLAGADAQADAFVTLMDSEPARPRERPSWIHVRRGGLALSIAFALIVLLTLAGDPESREAVAAGIRQIVAGLPVELPHVHTVFADPLATPPLLGYRPPTSQGRQAPGRPNPAVPPRDPQPTAPPKLPVSAAQIEDDDEGDGHYKGSEGQPQHAGGAAPPPAPKSGTAVKVLPPPSSAATPTPSVPVAGKQQQQSQRHGNSDQDDHEGKRSTPSPPSAITAVVKQPPGQAKKTSPTPRSSP